MKKFGMALAMAAGLSLAVTGVVSAHDEKPANVALDPEAVEKAKLRSHNPHTYKDLEGHFSKESVVRLHDMGVMNQRDGVETFEPNKEFDRKELAKWVKTLLGKDIGAGEVTIESTVTRKEIAKVIASAMPAVNTGIAGDKMFIPFIDLTDLSAEEKSAAHLLYRLGIMVGDGKGHFQPNDTLTKGEAAVLMERVFERSMQAATSVMYDVFAAETDLPEAAYTMVQENKTMPGVYSIEDGEHTYIMVAGGEVADAGKKVKVNKVSETEAGVFVEAVLESEPSDKMVAQVISYPYQVLKVKNKKKPVYLF